MTLARPTRKRTGIALSTVGVAALVLTRFSDILPDVIVLALSIGGIGLIGLGVLTFRGIDRSGIQGTASISSVTDLGPGAFEGIERFELGLLVELPGQQPYPARTIEGLAPEARDRLAIGTPLVVKVDRRDPGGVLVDWVVSAQRLGWLPEGEVPSG